MGNEASGNSQFLIRNSKFEITPPLNVIMQIRNAKPTDDLSNLLTQLGYPTTKEVATDRLKRILNSQGAAFVSEENGNLTGFIHITEGFGIEHDAFAQIRALVVDEAHRNEKLGE